MNPAQALRHVQGLVILLFRDVGLQNALQTQVRRGFVLSQRVWLESNRREERFINDVRSQLDLIAWNQIAFPEFKGPVPNRRLVGDRAHDKTAIRLEVIVLEKFLATLERKISAIDEVFVKLVALGVDI